MGLLNPAEELGNVSKACQVMGLSRDTFYRYRDAVEEGGVEALLERTRRVPNPKNRVDLETEEAVVAYAVEYPAHGQVRVKTGRAVSSDVGVTGVEKHLLVPDDILQEFAVGERSPADIVGGEARQVEPVPGEPFGTVREPAPVAFEMDQRGLFPEGACRREDRHGRGGIVELRCEGGNVGNDRVLLVGIDDVAAAEFQQDLTPDIAAQLLDGGRIGETEVLSRQLAWCQLRVASSFLL